MTRNENLDDRRGEEECATPTHWTPKSGDVAESLNQEEGLEGGSERKNDVCRCRVVSPVFLHASAGSESGWHGAEKRGLPDRVWVSWGLGGVECSQGMMASSHRHFESFFSLHSLLLLIPVVVALPSRHSWSFHSTDHSIPSHHLSLISLFSFLHDCTFSFHPRTRHSV